MKQVFRPTELSKVWLRQSQSSGRTQGNNFYFDGDTIYSYGQHFPIARIFDAPNGERVSLFTTRKYSSTTQRHCSRVFHVVRNSNYRVVYCEKIDGVLSHELNLNSFKYDMNHVAVKHAKARKPELYKEGILHQGRMARDYCELMCLSVPSWAMLPDGIEAGAPLIAAMKVHANEVSHV